MLPAPFGPARRRPRPLAAARTPPGRAGLPQSRPPRRAARYRGRRPVPAWRARLRPARRNAATSGWVDPCLAATRLGPARRRSARVRASAGPGQAAAPEFRPGGQVGGGPGSRPPAAGFFFGQFGSVEPGQAVGDLVRGRESGHRRTAPARPGRRATAPMIRRSSGDFCSAAASSAARSVSPCATAISRSSSCRYLVTLAEDSESGRPAAARLPSHRPVAVSTAAVLLSSTAVRPGGAPSDLAARWPSCAASSASVNRPAVHSRYIRFDAARTTSSMTGGLQRQGERGVERGQPGVHVAGPGQDDPERRQAVRVLGDRAGLVRHRDRPAGPAARCRGIAVQHPPGGQRGQHPSLHGRRRGVFEQRRGLRCGLDRRLKVAGFPVIATEPFEQPGPVGVARWSLSASTSAIQLAARSG